MAKKPNNLSNREIVKNKRTHLIKSDFESRKKDYEELKNLRQILKEKKEIAIKKAKHAREQKEENKKRKELNMLKSGKYEIIKNPEKIKKWKKKARKLLQKLPLELFYEKNYK